MVAKVCRKERHTTYMSQRQNDVVTFLIGNETCFMPSTTMCAKNSFKHVINFKRLKFPQKNSLILGYVCTLILSQCQVSKLRYTYTCPKIGLFSLVRLIFLEEINMQNPNYFGHKVTSSKLKLFADEKLANLLWCYHSQVD